MPASRNYASKDITSRHLLTFVRSALQSKVPMSAITSSMLQNSKCKCRISCFWQGLGVFLKRKERRILHDYNFCHVPYARESWFSTLCHNSSDTICYKNNNFGFPKGFPTFWAKKENYYSLLLFICHYLPTLFTGTIHCYCSLRSFAYLRGAVPYIWGKCFLCLVQDFFLRESFPLRAFLCENILAYYNFLPTLQDRKSVV